MPTRPCPCGSHKPLARCCGPFLEGSATPKTVKQLMRSRYTAYALGGHGEYLLATWHPDTTPPVAAAVLSAVEQQWLGLSVLDYSQRGDSGTVEFAARFTDGDGISQVHHEVSRFQRVGGKWLYLDALG